ncbi:hypothetical protein K491DRAFT_729488 [Lophiostoma macrostomum CBS 122681]|uniref:Uncharacterized protein n=1 Tax=Lophiostoma macrostomum CBS 122681 TaxID=1314788 RepID=A0A6A6TNR8_9PLEO|nr:hypothetical protein K491DRAFT_729488 [Lophiostoma macrostomum CBS 122681]
MPWDLSFDFAADFFNETLHSLKLTDVQSNKEHASELFYQHRALYSLITSILLGLIFAIAANCLRGKYSRKSKVKKHKNDFCSVYPPGMQIDKVFLPNQNINSGITTTPQQRGIHELGTQHHLYGGSKTGSTYRPGARSYVDFNEIRQRREWMDERKDWYKESEAARNEEM